MAQVRALTRDDIPEVTRLHVEVFGKEKPIDLLQCFLTDLFCDHPWSDSTFNSLVYENDSGCITGRLGVMPRPMMLGSQCLQAAVSHNYVVHPDSRNELAAIRLLKEFLSGPQDLSLADGNHISRKLWEGLGGRTLFSHSLRWVRLLQPLHSVLSLARKRGLPNLLSRLLSVPARGLDSVLTRVPALPFCVKKPPLVTAEISAERLFEQLDGFSRNFHLRPFYDLSSLTWLLQMLNKYQKVSKTAVYNGKGDVVGWYIYYVRPGAVAQVLQLVARSDKRETVLAHLLHDAWRQKALAVTGQVDPHWLEAFAENYCFFDNTQFWTLVHSRRPEVLDALHRSDVFLTRLEGESWIRLAF